MKEEALGEWLPSHLLGNDDLILEARREVLMEAIAQALAAVSPEDALG